LQRENLIILKKYREGVFGSNIIAIQMFWFSEKEIEVKQAVKCYILYSGLN